MFRPGNVIAVPMFIVKKIVRRHVPAHQPDPCHKARPVATWSIGIGQANRNANPLVRFGIREATSEGLFHHYRRNNGGGHLDARPFVFARNSTMSVVVRNYRRSRLE